MAKFMYSEVRIAAASVLRKSCEEARWLQLWCVRAPLDGQGYGHLLYSYEGTKAVSKSRQQGLTRTSLRSGCFVFPVDRLACATRWTKRARLGLTGGYAEKCTGIWLLGTSCREGGQESLGDERVHGGYRARCPASWVRPRIMNGARLCDKIYPNCGKPPERRAPLSQLARG